jgi:hypothetical protein
MKNTSISEKVVEKRKTHFVMFNNFFRKSYISRDNVGKKFGGATETKDDDKIKHIRFECWTTKATNRHSEYVILLAFARQKLLPKRA